MSKCIKYIWNYRVHNVELNSSKMQIEKWPSGLENNSKDAFLKTRGLSAYQAPLSGGRLHNSKFTPKNVHNDMDCTGPLVLEELF